MDRIPTERSAAPDDPGARHQLDYATPSLRRWRIGTLSYTKAGLILLFCWLLWGDFAYQFRDRAVGPTLQLLLNRFHASDTVIGLLTGVLPSVIVISLSPAISYLSDRHRGRWGRRIPFLLIITPIAVISMLGLAFTPEVGESIQKLFRVKSFDSGALSSIGIFWAIFAACDTICNLVFTALCNDVVPRELIGRFFGLFRIVSLGAGIIFSFFLFKSAETHYVAIFISMAAIYGIGFTAMCLMVREGDYPPPDPKAPNPWRATTTYLRDCFSQPRYRWLFASIALATMSFVPINLFILFFAKSVHLDLGIYGKCAALQLFLSLVLAYPLGWLCDKIHPLRMAIISLVLFAIASALAFIFVRGPVGVAVAFVGVGTFAGWWYTANGPLCMTLFPKTQFAQFLAALGICSSVGGMIIGGLCGVFLDWVGRDYHYIYLWSFVLAILSLVTTMVVYRKFMVNGELERYIDAARK